jgi:dTDP-4-dehydrorhamnose reductase
MKILITGIGGQVGFELLRACQPLGEVIGVDIEQVNLANGGSVRHLLEETRPTVILNPAAYTAVDKAESEEELALAINGEAVRVMAEHSQRTGGLLIHYSTDYVFDGTKEDPYVARDQPAPLGAYGRTKLAGERALADSGCDYLCLRTSWVYASRGRNFLRTMLKLGQEREELRVVCDQVGAPTTARLLADVTVQCMQSALTERAQGRFRSELLHVTAGGATSWHGFALAILDLARARGEAIKTRAVVPIPTSAYPTPAQRPANSRLNCDRIKERFGVTLPEWEQGLRLCMNELIA